MSAAPIAFCSEFGRLESCGRQGLLLRARAGDREAFVEMVSPHLETMSRRARRLTGNAADAEDVSQEALLKAWSRLEQFSGKQDENADDFRAWLARIAGKYVDRCVAPAARRQDAVLTATPRIVGGDSGQRNCHAR